MTGQRSGADLYPTMFDPEVNIHFQWKSIIIFHVQKISINGQPSTFPGLSKCWLFLPLAGKSESNPCWFLEQLPPTICICVFVFYICVFVFVFLYLCFCIWVYLYICLASLSLIRGDFWSSCHLQFAFRPFALIGSKISRLLLSLGKPPTIWEHK